MLTAQASGAQVVALSSAGNDAVIAVLAAHEFAISPGSITAAMGLDSVDVEAIGLTKAQGL